MWFCRVACNTRWTSEVVLVVYFSGEDALSENLAHKCVQYALPRAEFSSMRPRQGGKQAVERNMSSYVASAKALKAFPIFVMLDLDDQECAPSARATLLARHAVETLPRNLVFSIVKREAEAWLLGDRPRISDFLGLDMGVFPRQPEELDDPKGELVNLAQKSRLYKRELCPFANASAKVGPGYNHVLSGFIRTHWRPEIAADNCPSLERALARLANLGE